LTFSNGECEDTPTNLLVVSLGKALNEIASMIGYTGSNRRQLDSKTEKVTSLSTGRGTLTNK